MKIFRTELLPNEIERKGANVFLSRVSLVGYIFPR